MQGIASLAALDLVASPAPQVQVLVRAAGSAQALARCLHALQRALHAIPAQVVVVDDSVGQGFAGVVAGVPGLEVVRTGASGAAQAGAGAVPPMPDPAAPLHRGYRAAVDALLASSSAPFAWLLDASVEVAEDSLRVLLGVMHRQPRCGAVGGKLLDAAGRIVQSGGVAWSDGTRCSHGQGEAADVATCRYLREVDFCSGAMLLLRRAALGGQPAFDDGWAGADFAETGLACALRQRGWQVLHAPRAVAVDHGDGTWLGNPTAGARAAALAEAAFAQRWSATLARRHFAPCRRMFRAREHAMGRRVVLVVDHYLPQVDRDAGSRAIVQTMQALQGLGMLVKFWPANQARPEAEAQALEEAGIEVVVGDRWGGQLARYLRHAGSELDDILLSRPDVARDVIDAARAHSAARIVFYGHDLHHRRMALQAELTGDEADQRAATAMAGLEHAIWRQVDAVVYPSAEEAAVAAAVVGPGKVHAVPLYVFDDGELAAGRAPAGRARLLFVAGFGHSPNVDAARWLVQDILPRVRQRLPAATLDLVGSHPTAEVRALAAVPGVTVTGSVSAQALADHYRQADVAVVPLRFGAGVKLKVLEAMARGVPVVTTPVGAQGLPGVEACIDVADAADALADAICAVAGAAAPDPARASAARAYVRLHYGGDGMRRALLRVFHGREALPGRPAAQGAPAG